MLLFFYYSLLLPISPVNLNITMSTKEVWGGHVAPITTDKYLAELRQKHGVPPSVEMILSPGPPYTQETVPTGY
ncbi:hypothetical protein CARUB_v10022487mg [Capsella rubella]|uniref:Uncharacterized protein n=1 Tax=Capsella rubella TaxID=81985 RepID=R0GGQ2_9BRAS|nr:hypothetical protein CARUB_v10022487mg [Capsella rubella]